MQPSWRKYIWKSGNAWFGFAHRVAWTVEGSLTNHRELIPAWGRILSALAGLGFLAWIALVSAVWYHSTRVKQFDTVTWADVAFPWQWDERRVKQGHSLLARVEPLFKERRFREGLFALQVGLKLAPRDLQARRTFAAIQKQLGREDLAAQLLAEGVPFASADADFVQLAVEANLEAQAYEAVIALADAWSRQIPRAETADETVQLTQAQALGFLGRTQEAAAVLDHIASRNTPRVALVRAQILWANRDASGAVRLLQEASDSQPEADELSLRLIQYANLLAREDLAEQVLRVRIEREPRNAARALDLLRWQADRGRWAEFEAGLAIHVQRAAGSEPVLLGVARLLARLGRVEDQDRLAPVLIGSESAAPIFGLARIDALIVARRFEEARADLLRWRERWETSLPIHGIDITIATALILGSVDASGEFGVALGKVLEAEQLGPRGFVTVADRFTALGRPASALRVLQRALELSPRDSGTLRTLAVTSAELGNWDVFSETINRVLARRHTDPALLSDLAEHLQSDLSLYVPGRAALLKRLEQGG